MLLSLIFFIRSTVTVIIAMHPGDFRCGESPQTLPALFIGLSEHVDRFRNLKFAVKVNRQRPKLSCGGLS